MEWISMAIVHWMESLSWGGILLGSIFGVGNSFIKHIARLDIIALGDLSVHSSSSTILSIKLLHSSLRASVRIIIQTTDLILILATTKEHPPSLREILEHHTAAVLLLHLMYITANPDP